MAAPVDDRALLELFESGLDDWVSLVEVGGTLSRLLAVPDDLLCAEMTRCVRALVEAGWFRAGVVEEADGFVPIARSLDEVLHEVCDDWTWDDRSWWYSLWLELTDEGRVEALRSFAEISQEFGTYLDRRVLFGVFAPALAERVSLATVADSLRDQMALSDDEICAEVRRYVIGLVVEGWFRPGTADDARFVPLTEPLDELLAELFGRWDGSQQDRWGSAVWLELTDEGRTEALRRFPALSS
jgi:hypothetical protein